MWRRQTSSYAPLRVTSLPALVFGLAVALGALVLVWSVLETRTQDEQLEMLADASGAALAESLGHAVEDTLRAALEIEEQMAHRLLEQARLIDRLEAEGLLHQGDLSDLSHRLDLDQVAVLDDEGRPTLSTPGGASWWSDTRASRGSSLEPVLSGRGDFLVLGSHARQESRPEFVALVRRAHEQGSVVVTRETRDMLAFLQDTSADHLLGGIAMEEGVVYAVLRDAEGNLIAGEPPERPISGDFLDFDRPVRIAHDEMGRLHVGLSTQSLTTARAAGRRRTVVLGVALFGLALALSTATLARQRAEALRAETARARATADAVLGEMVDAVLLIDDEGLIRLVNPAASRLFGGTPEQLLGRKVAELPCPCVAQRLAGGRSVQECAFAGAEGEAIPVLVSVSPVRIPSADPVGTAVLLRDLRELRELQEKTARAENLAALGRLAATVAHEVRNPLNAIAVGAQRLDREYEPRDDVDGYARLTSLLRDEVSRLDEIVNRFLDFARTPTPDPRPGNLDAVMLAAMPVVQRSLPDGIRLRSSFELGAEALFDPMALRQVLFNLTRNAAEALGAAGHIMICTRAEDGSALLEVEDDGPGIPTETQEHLFEFGFTTKAWGTGLGLPIVNRLVTEMNGSVSVESDPARGTVVQVRLPLATDSVRESACMPVTVS